MNKMKWKFEKEIFLIKDEGKMVFKVFKNDFKICEINFVEKKKNFIRIKFIIFSETKGMENSLKLSR